LLALPQSRNFSASEQWFIKIDAAAHGRTGTLREKRSARSVT